MKPSALEQLRQAGLLVYADPPDKLMVSPRSLLTPELHQLAKEHLDDIVADLAEEEVHAGWRQRSAK